MERHLTSRRLGIDLGEQLFQRTRGRRTERLVEVNGFAELIAHQRIAARELGIPRERLFDALGIATAERSRRMPRQELFDFLALGRF